MSKTLDFSQLIPIFEATPSLIAAWVFGSAQNGQLRSGSDVDMALLMSTQPSFGEQLDLLGQLQTALGVEDIDLVILNQANPILRFEAISGRSLFCRDKSKRAEFASLTAREYEDEMAQYERALRNHQI